MSSLSTSLFTFHDDTIDILIGNRVVNHVQLTNTRILALHRIGKLDAPQVFVLYVSSNEPGLHAILFRLALVTDVETLVPVMRIDVSSLLTISSGLSLSKLSPEHVRIHLYLREEHVCLQLSDTYIVYANLRLLHRVDSGGVYRFVLPPTASCTLNIHDTGEITSMNIRNHLYVCVGNTLLRSMAPINIHILSKRQTPVTFQRIAMLSMPGDYVYLNKQIFADSSLAELDSHHPGYDHPTALLSRPINVSSVDRACTSPPFTSITTVKHYIMNISGVSQALTFLIGTLVHNSGGCFCFLDLAIYTYCQVKMTALKRYTKSEMASMCTFKLYRTVGRINLDELCTYKLPGPSDGDLELQQLCAPSPYPVSTSLEHFILCPIRAMNSYFYFSMSFIARYTDTDAFSLFYTFQVNCGEADIRLLIKEIYLLIPRTPDCNEFSLSEQTLLGNTVTSMHLISFISDRSENILYVHDNTRVYFLMIFTEKLKFVSGSDLTLFIYSYSNVTHDTFNVYNLTLLTNDISSRIEGFSFQERGHVFTAASCRYISSCNFGMEATFLRLVGFGKNLMLIQGLSEGTLSVGKRVTSENGELIKVTIFLEIEGKYVSRSKFLILPRTGRIGTKDSLKHAIFTSFERYRQLYVVFCIEQAPDNDLRIIDDTLQQNSLVKIASTMSLTRVSSALTIESEVSTDSFFTVGSDMSDTLIKQCVPRQGDFSSAFPYPNTGLPAESSPQTSSLVRDFDLLTIVFSMSGNYLFSTGFIDLDQEAVNETGISAEQPLDGDRFKFLSTGVTRFRCVPQQMNMVPHRLFYVFPNDCLRLSFLTPYDSRQPLQRHKIHVERFFLPFLSIATCFLSSTPTILRTYTSHIHTTLFRRFITNVLTSSHYLFDITVRDKLQPNLIMRYASFSLYDVSTHISDFTSILLLSISQHYDYDSHLSNYLLTRLATSASFSLENLYPYLVTGVLCLTKHLGPKSSENTSQELAYDLPTWLESYLSMKHVNVSCSALLAQSGSISRISISEAHAFKTGLFRIIPSLYLKGLFTAIGDTEYRTAKTPNSVVTFYYALTNRLAVLANLYTRAQNPKVAAFLKSHTYTGEGSARSMEIARKNAFVLLAKCDYYMAAAWFFLAADFDKVLTVFVDQRYVGNVDLGITIFRYLRDVICNTTLPFTRIFPTLDVSLIDFSLMRDVLFNATFGKYVVTGSTVYTESAENEGNFKHTIMNFTSTEPIKIHYEFSSHRARVDTKEFIKHCTVAYDLLYYYFVLNQYEESNELLAAIITDVVATIISFTQHTTLETNKMADILNTVPIVLHILHNFVFLCFQYKLVDEIRSILNVLYRLYSCNIFGPLEKLRILNLSMYILVLSRRTLSVMEGMESFFLPSTLSASKRRLFNAFELSFMSLIHLHSNTLLASLLYNMFLYSLNPSRYLGSNHLGRAEELRSRCLLAANKELADAIKDLPSEVHPESTKRLISTIVFYMCVGFFTGAGKRAVNLLYKNSPCTFPEHAELLHLNQRLDYFDSCMASAVSGSIRQRRNIQLETSDNDADNSSYSYSDSENEEGPKEPRGQCTNTFADPSSAHSQPMAEIHQGNEAVANISKRKRRCRLQTDNEVEHICRIVCLYFKNIFKFTQSPHIMNSVISVLESFESIVLPSVTSTIEYVTRKEVYDVTDSLLGLVTTLSKTNDAAKKLLDSMISGDSPVSDAYLFQSESEYQPIVMSDRERSANIQQLLFKRHDTATSASSDNEKLRQPRLRERGVVTISDMEMHTTLLSDTIGASYDGLGENDYERTNQPFGKHPLLRYSLGFVVVVSNMSLIIERYDALLEFYSYLTLTPGGHTRYVPSSFNDSLAATAHPISSRYKEAPAIGFEMLSTFLSHSHNSLSYIVQHGMSVSKRVEPPMLDHFLSTNPQNQLSDVRTINLFYILLALHEYTINNGNMLLFRNTMQSKYGVHIQLNQLLEKTGNCSYKEILPAYYDIFREIQRNALTPIELSYLKMLECTGSNIFNEKLLIIKKLMLLEIYYLISRYKTTSTKESRLHSIRTGHESSRNTLIPCVLITFIKSPFVCFLNGLLNHVFYSPRLKLNAVPVDLLHKPRMPAILAEELLLVLRNTLFWQTHVAKDLKITPAAVDHFFETRLLQYSIILSKYILLYLYPSSVLIFSIKQAETTPGQLSPTTSSSKALPTIPTTFDSPSDDEDSETYNDGNLDISTRMARKNRLRARKRDQQIRGIYELSLLLEYTNVTSFVQTSDTTLYLLMRSAYIISLTLHTEGEIATVSAPILANFPAERLIGGLNTINDLCVLFSKSMYSIFCKDGIILPAVSSNTVKFGLAEMSLLLKTATIHDMALLTNLQALALISYIECESSENDQLKLVLATLNLLNCSIIDGIELTESYTRILMTKLRDIQVLLLFGPKEYCILCKHVAGATDSYIKTESGLLPEDMTSSLVLAEAFCTGDRVIYRIIYSVSRVATKTHVITYYVNVT